jgi:hypothetical protein
MAETDYSRSAYAAIGSLKADVDQMQKDVEKIKLYGQQALVLGVYTLAVAALIYLTLRSLKGAVSG